MFVTPEDYHAVLVYNLTDGKLIHTIEGIGRPHAVLYRTDLNRIYVTDGGAGEVKVYDGTNYQLVQKVKLLADADSIAYDPATHYLYVDNGGGDVHQTYSMLSVVDTSASRNFVNWNPCSGLENAKGLDLSCSVAFKYGMKRDFNTWLQSLGPKAPVKTLTELRQWNIAHQRAGAIKYGQANLDISDEMDIEKDRARYEADRAKDIRLGGTHGIDEVMKAEQLDAILFPAASGAAIAARPGYPTVIVPFAFVPNAPTPAFPAGRVPRRGRTEKPHSRRPVPCRCGPG